MDPQEHRDRGVDGGDPCQWYRGLSIRKRVLVGALHLVTLFVVLLAAYFASDYFGITGDQRGNVVGSLADAAERSAFWSAGYGVLYRLLGRLLQR
jgi:hypothetical protein